MQQVSAVSAQLTFATRKARRECRLQCIGDRNCYVNYYRGDLREGASFAILGMGSKNNNIDRSKKNIPTC